MMLSFPHFSISVNLLTDQANARMHVQNKNVDGRMKMHISACGLICDECEYFNQQCSGCNGVKGRTFWAVQSMPNKTCPLYFCAVETHHLHHCGECPELPCSKYFEMKDPKSSEEEHKTGIVQRVKVLREQAQKGQKKG
jgi:hypothetical protein